MRIEELTDAVTNNMIQKMREQFSQIGQKRRKMKEKKNREERMQELDTSRRGWKE